MRTRICIALIVMALATVHGLGRHGFAGEWIGTVTVAQGTATVERGGHLYRLQRGAGILSSDELHTSEDGLVTLVLDQGPSISMGARSVLFINRLEDRWHMDVSAGQTRVVHDGATPLRLTAKDSSIWVERSILHLEATDDRIEFELKAGSILYESTSMLSKRFSERGTYEARTGHRPKKVVANDWALKGNQIRLVAAMQTTPTLQPPQSTDPAAIAPPLVDNGVAPDDLPATNAPIFNDEDEALPQFTQPTTRGALAGATVLEDDAQTPTNVFGGSSSLSLGSLFSSVGNFSSGASNFDANQQTFQGQITESVNGFNAGDPFPGAIHLVTGETRLPFDEVRLSTAEFNGLFSGSVNKYFSIGEGTAPTGQVLTNFFTGTSATPNVIDVPRFGIHLIEAGSIQHSRFGNRNGQ